MSLLCLRALASYLRPSHSNLSRPCLWEVDHRTVTSLNGDWHYLVDQSPARALYTPNGEINDKSYALNEHPNIVGKHNQEYDFSTAPTLKVPGDWNTQIPRAL